MSNFIKEVNGKRYACMDNWFGGHQYGYIELKEGENWENFDTSVRKVYTEEEFFKICKL